MPNVRSLSTIGRGEAYAPPGTSNCALSSADVTSARAVRMSLSTLSGRSGRSSPEAAALRPFAAGLGRDGLAVEAF